MGYDSVHLRITVVQVDGRNGEVELPAVVWRLLQLVQEHPLRVGPQVRDEQLLVN